MKKRKSNKKQRHKKRVMIISVVILLLLLLACGFIINYSYFGKVNDVSEISKTSHISRNDEDSELSDIVSESVSESTELSEGEQSFVSEVPLVSETEESSTAESESSAEESSAAESSEEKSVENSKVSSDVSEVSEPVIPKADLSVIRDYDSKYFVKKLSDEHKYYFAELYLAAKEHKQSVTFEVPIHEKYLTVLMYLLNYDCPELIHLSGDYYPEYTGTNMEYVDRVTFSYCMTKDEYSSAMQKSEDFLAELKAATEGKSDLEKEKYVYDYIFGNCLYIEQLELSGSAYGSLIMNYGRCEAYCKGFMWCMRELGIECICVSGTQYWDPSAMFSEHSWNIVNIEGDWYHVDITADNVQVSESSDNPPNYGFFNVDDEFVSGSRDISDVYTNLGVPVCNSSELNYHKLNDLLIPSGGILREETEYLLSEYFGDSGINALSIKFESREDYEEALVNIESWLSDFFNENSDNVYLYNTYYNDLSGTIVINAWKNNAEGE